MASDTTTYDETLVCCGCHRSFVFSNAEKIVHDRNGYKNKPKRCKPCRESRRSGIQPQVMEDQDMLIEICKAVGELRVFVEHKLKKVEKCLTNIEKKIQSGDR